MTFDIFPYILCVMGGFTLATVLRSILTKMEADDEAQQQKIGADNLAMYAQMLDDQNDLLSRYTGLGENMWQTIGEMKQREADADRERVRKQNEERRVNRQQQQRRMDMEFAAVRGPSPVSLDMVNAIVAEGR